MLGTLPLHRRDLPTAAFDLATRLVTVAVPDRSIVTLAQTGRMKQALGRDAWMSFAANQTIETGACNFAWCARFSPFGSISVCDALENGVARLDVTALGFIPMVRTNSTPALVRGELMRYLAELPWAPDAILENSDLRWREGSFGELMVGAGEGSAAVEVSLGLDSAGRIDTIFAQDRPRSAIEPILPTPWRGRFSDYRLHLGRWIPFAGEVAWEIDGREEVYWQGKIERWSISPAEQYQPGRCISLPNS